MRVFLLLILVSTVSYNSYSQPSFRKGYIIDSKNDTTYGLLNYKGGDGNYFQCRFKKSEDGEVREYRPQDINGYQFLKDKLFVSKSIDNPSGESEKVFLQVLVKGKLTLYRYDNHRFFINKDDSALHELINTQEVKKIGEKHLLTESNKHRGLLIYYTSDCSELSKRASNIRLYEIELTEFVEDYNKCLELPSISYKGNKPWFKTSLGFVSAYNRAKLYFFQVNSSLYFLDFTSFTTGSLMPGINLELTSPRLNENTAAILQIMYNFNNADLYLSENYYSSSISRHISIKLREVKIPAGFRYTFNGKRINPYINAGFFYSFNINSSAWIVVERESPDYYYNHEYEPFFIYDKQLSAWVGIGVKKSISSRYHAFLELRYDSYNGFLKYEPGHYDNYANTHVRNFQILAGFNLF